jgi:hypothetical protein
VSSRQSCWDKMMLYTYKNKCWNSKNRDMLWKRLCITVWKWLNMLDSAKNRLQVSSYRMDSLFCP